ncbi:MAG: choice-of-anchor D domain-containing protein, partial [Candidatus Binatus sp.]
MSRWPNRFVRPSPEPRSRHSSVASIKLAAARAGRFAAIALTATLMLACIGTAPAHAAVIRLTISPLVLVFAEQEVETTSAAKNVTLTNPNSSALQITSVTPSGDFSLSSDGCSGNDLAPAADCVVSVVFTPSQAGTRTGALTIIDAAANSPQTVSLSGKGILLRPTFSPTHLSFGEQPLDVPSAAQTITLTNPNLVPLSVTSVVPSGDFTTTNDNCSGTQVAAAGTCTFGVIFTPSQTGVRESKIIVTDDAYIPTQSITVVGVGYIVTPTVSPTSLSFGRVQVGTISPAKTVTLTNSNVVPVTFTSITISGPFVITANSCDGSVPASSSCQVSVTFNPTTDTNPNGSAETGKLTFVDDAQVTTKTVALVGVAFGTVATATATATPTATATDTATATP